MQYKLKAWYPSLPEDWEPGDIIEKVYIPVNKNKTKTSLQEKHIKENQEFWEPVTDLIVPMGTRFICYPGGIEYLIKEINPETLKVIITWGEDKEEYEISFVNTQIQDKKWIPL